MGRASVPLRVFLALAIALVPVLLLGIGFEALSRGPLRGASTPIIAATLVGFTAVWAAVLSVVYSRALDADAATLVRLARYGEPTTVATTALDERGDERQLAEALDERNRQVATLAAEAAAAPITDDPAAAAAHVVAAARRVTRDPTWSLAVLNSDATDLLAAGVYDGGGHEPEPIKELHRWASVSAGADDADGPHRVEGPWGAFIVVPLGVSAELSAILYAPWEGRPRLSSAERNLLSLVGIHAATALEHALLYARVRSQAISIERMAAVQQDFLRGVSHDLQTPLTSIRAVATELRSRPGLDAAAASDLDLIEHQADRLRRMVGQLLAVSRLEAGAMVPQIEVFNVRPLVERTWAALRARDRELSVEISGPPQLVVADPDRLEQVLWALLDNAVKYSPAGSPIDVSIGAASGSDNGDGARATITVSDQGIGMDPSTAARAFEQFFRDERVRRIAPDGSGIGLYAAHGLVRAMDGTIEVSSTLGRGSAFVVTLPAERADAESGEPVTVSGPG